MRPLQMRVLRVNIAKGLPHASTLIDLVGTQSDHFSKGRVRATFGVTLCPQGSALSQRPVTAGQSQLSAGDELIFGFDCLIDHGIGRVL
jgi:hypothetical protein